MRAAICSRIFPIREGGIISLPPAAACAGLLTPSTWCGHFLLGAQGGPCSPQSGSALPGDSAPRPPARAPSEGHPLLPTKVPGAQKSCSPGAAPKGTKQTSVALF